MAGGLKKWNRPPTSRPPKKVYSNVATCCAELSFFTFILVCSETISCRSPVYCALFPEQTCIISSSIRKVLVIDLIEKSEGSG